MATVLVLGAGGNAANNYVRSIMDEHHVVGVDPDSLMLMLSDAPQVVALRDDIPHLNQIQGIVQKFNVDAIWAQPTREVEWLAADRDKIGAKTFLPPLDVIQLCNDKLATAHRLSTVAPPSTGIEDIESYLTKYGEVWMRQRYGAGSAGAIVIRSKEQAFHWLDHWFDTAETVYDSWMIAQRLTGLDLSWTGIYEHGTLVISCAKERIKLLGEQASAAQVSSTAKAQMIVHRDDVNAVAERGIELVAGPQAHGVFMVDLREDEAGHPKITEINAGRFGTTNDMYQYAGPNLPMIATELALGTYDGDYELREQHNEAVWIRNTDCIGRMVAAAVNTEV